MLFHPFSDQMLAMLSRQHVTAVTAVRIDLLSGVACAHSGVGTIVIAGETYLGVGSLGKISPASEKNGTSPTQIELQLSGFETSVLASVTNEKSRGRSVKVMLVALNDNGTVGAADLMFSGHIASVGVTAGDTNEIAIVASNRFERWQIPLPNRFNDESHRARNLDDRLFRYVAQMADREIFWGSKKDAPAFNYE